MWRLILYFEDQGSKDTGLYDIEVKEYKTYRGALQGGRYYWRHRPDIKEYEVTQSVD